MTKSQNNRLLSGIQPTGKMHLGNYWGAVSNWVQLQSEFDSFILIVDLHSLTSIYEDPVQLRKDKFELAIDLLSCGIDPNQCCFFMQSDVPAHAELHLILSMITPLPWLTRVPNYKGKIQEMKDKDLNTYGFLGYPVLMASDILLYKANTIPVGKDQVAHLELTREIARRFNQLYQPVFPEPNERLTQSPIVPGSDGRKMSKSYNNTIPIDISEDELSQSLKKMMTDPARKLRTDPGTPEICPVFQFHKLYSSSDRIQEIAQDCQTAKIGCVDCKKECASRINETLEVFRQRRAQLVKDPDTISDILAAGAKRASEVATQTLTEVKHVIGL